ncbi:MAG: hypothetical protein JXR83_14125 [Deltaproteobacteria bacterium]|nr:hypothetical protein [Deltaproteobacteria bacterium]
MRLLPTALVLLAVAGCGYGAVSVEGTFDGERFAPTGTVFAVLDAHVEEPRPGGGIAVIARDDPRLLLFFCQPAIDPDVDFAALSGSEIEELRELVRRGDRVLLRDLPTHATVAGARLVLDDGRADFALLMLAGSAPIAAGDSYADLRPLGRHLSAVLAIERAVLAEKGQLVGALALARDRAADQPANTVTGTVTLQFDAPIVSERIGESNLRVLGY